MFLHKAALGRWSKRYAPANNSVGFVAMLMNIKGDITEFSDQLTDYWLLVQVYSISLMVEKDRAARGLDIHWDYKIVCITFFMATTA